MREMKGRTAAAPSSDPVDGWLTGLTEDQAFLRDKVREFVASHLPPGTARRADATGQFPLDKYRAYADQGLLGVGIPAEYGGRGGGFVYLAIALEELAKGMMSFSLMVFRSAVHGAQTL